MINLFKHSSNVEICVIDKDSQKSLGRIDIVPNIDEHLILSSTMNWFKIKFNSHKDITKNKFEVQVVDIVYDLPDNLIFIYVEKLEKDKSYLYDLDKINWKNKEL